MPLPDLFRRWYGPIPPIKATRGQTGDWDGVGQSRTVLLTGGGSMREELTSYDPPRSFGYTLSQVKGPLAPLVDHVDGLWLFAPIGTGTQVTWRWTIHPPLGAGRAGAARLRPAVEGLRPPVAGGTVESAGALRHAARTGPGRRRAGRHRLGDRGAGRNRRRGARYRLALVNSDVLLGTSAGSAVAAQIGSGADLDELYARQTAEESHEIDSGVTVDDITEVFLTALGAPGSTRERLQRIGAIALAAETVPESVRRDGHRAPVALARLARPGSTDHRDRHRDRRTGGLHPSIPVSPLVDAVAASCAVPGAWPPVTIDGRRYMDGGVGSTVHMAVAAGLRRGGGAGARRRERAVPVRSRHGRRDRGLPRPDVRGVRRR